MPLLILLLSLLATGFCAQHVSGVAKDEQGNSSATSTTSFLNARDSATVKLDLSKEHGH